MSVTRVLPKPSVSRDDVTHLAWDRGWRYHDMFGANETQPFEKIWLTPDGLTSIHWIEDHVLGLPYLLLQGKSQDEAAHEIASALPTVDRSDLRAIVDEARTADDLVAALRHVAAAAPPEFDAEIFEWFERGFEHEDAAVRKIAAIASAYPAWPEFRARLLETASNDADPDVREAASIRLYDLDQKLARD